MLVDGFTNSLCICTCTRTNTNVDTIRNTEQWDTSLQDSKRHKTTKFYVDKLGIYLRLLLCIIHLIDFPFRSCSIDNWERDLSPCIRPRYIYIYLMGLFLCLRQDELSHITAVHRHSHKLISVTIPRYLPSLVYTPKQLCIYPKPRYSHVSSALFTFDKTVVGK